MPNTMVLIAIVQQQVLHLGKIKVAQPLVLLMASKRKRERTRVLCVLGTSFVLFLHNHLRELPSG